MRNVQFILALLFGLGISNLHAQEAPGAKQTKSILLLNGSAHLGTGEMINRSAIVLENGKIVKVMNALTNTINNADYDTVIDIKDKQHLTVSDENIFYPVKGLTPPLAKVEAIIDN